MRIIFHIRVTRDMVVLTLFVRVTIGWVLGTVSFFFLISTYLTLSEF